jgi:predicted DNA-binding protein
MEVSTMGDRLIIEKRPLKGEDGYKVFSIRISDETVERLDEISQQTNRSRNELIKMFIEYGLNNCEIK